MKRKIKIQDVTPYQDSLKWKIHRNYFQKRGIEAWKTREVPFDITSNSQAAYQNAYLVFRMVENSAYKKGQKIKVLEMASGLGVFALNFIKTFTDICIENNKDYHENLHYMFSDYAQKSVEEAAKNKYLSELKDKGILDFYILDALNPKDATRLDGKKFNLEKESLTVAIANYLHCTLPIKVLRKKDNRFFENNTELYMLLDENEKDYLPEEIDAMIDNPVKVDLLAKLEEVAHYLEINIETQIKDDILRESYMQLLKSIDVSTAELPIGAVENLDKIMPFIKKTGGLIISDKGYANTEYMVGEHECFFSVHGNSFAHSLNFPLLEIYANKKGYFTNRTNDYLNSLQVLLVTKELNNNLDDEFVKQFVENNFNEDTHDYLDTGYKEKYEKNFAKAVRYYRKAIKHRVHDARVFFDIGSSYIGYGDQEKALYYLLNHPEDYLDEHDFDFEIGMAYDYSRDYSKALEYYTISAQKFPNQKETFFNLANVHHKMKNFLEAYVFYQKALILKSDYEIAITGMKNLKDDMFNDWLNKNGIEINLTDFEEIYKQAEKDFNQAITGNIDEDEIKKSLETFLALAEQMPAKAEIHSKIAMIFYVLGDIEKSHKYLDEANILNPNLQETGKLRNLLEKALVN